MKKQKEEKRQKTLAREILEWVLTIAAAVIIAVPIRAFAFELVRMDGKSMDNTLERVQSINIVQKVRLCHDMALSSLAGRGNKGKCGPHHDRRRSSAF